MLSPARPAPCDGEAGEPASQPDNIAVQAAANINRASQVRRMTSAGASHVPAVYRGESFTATARPLLEA
jgi:hypothetical protein